LRDYVKNQSEVEKLMGSLKIEPRETASTLKKSSTLAPLWIPDIAQNKCSLCQEKFTLLKRKHHCRKCGRLICSNCSKGNTKLLSLQDKQNRICKSCFSQENDQPFVKSVVTDEVSLPTEEEEVIDFEDAEDPLNVDLYAPNSNVPEVDYRASRLTIISSHTENNNLNGNDSAKLKNDEEVKEKRESCLNIEPNLEIKSQIVQDIARDSIINVESLHKFPKSAQKKNAFVDVVDDCDNELNSEVSNKLKISSMIVSEESITENIVPENNAHDDNVGLLKDDSNESGEVARDTVVVRQPIKIRKHNSREHNSPKAVFVEDVEEKGLDGNSLNREDSENVLDDQDILPSVQVQNEEEEKQISRNISNFNDSSRLNEFVEPNSHVQIQAEDVTLSENERKSDLNESILPSEVQNRELAH
jgi:hypothetical protein